MVESISLLTKGASVDNLPDGLDLNDLPDLDFGDMGMDDMDLDLSGFEMEAPAGKVLTRYVKPPLYVGERRSPVKYERAADMARDLAPAILAGERIDAVLSGNFIFGDFLEAFAVESNSFIDDLTISTLSLSKNNVDSLRNLLVGDYLETLNIIVSDYFYSHNRVNIGYIHEQLDVDDRFQLAVAGTHTKIILARIGEQKIVIHGSANLRSSRSVEVCTIETNSTVYDFHAEWHRRILDNYATVRKPVRAAPLFDLINQEHAS